MTTTKLTAREVLVKLVVDTQNKCMGCFEGEQELDQALKSLTDRLMGEMPKRKKLPLTKAAGMSVDQESVYYGYNQAIDEITAIIKKVLA